MHAEELLHVLSKEYPAKVEVLLLNALDVTGMCHFVPVYSSEGLFSVPSGCRWHC